MNITSTKLQKKNSSLYDLNHNAQFIDNQLFINKNQNWND